MSDLTALPSDLLVASSATSAAADFRVQARAVLGQLHEHLGHGTWLVTERVGDRWRVVESLDSALGLSAGATMPWADSICARMVSGLGPRIAPDLRSVPAYAEAPMAESLRLGAYVGVPFGHDGRLIGAICGLDRESQPSQHELLGLLETIAGMLGALRWHELRGAELLQRAARAEADAMVDPLTQLGTRLAWNQALAEEEARCRRSGRPSCVLTIDLDGLKRTNDSLGHDAGDRLIRDAGVVLRRASRMCDHVARLGGDEFGLLAVECDIDHALRLMTRIDVALAARSIEASIGCAERDPARGLEGAWHDADLAMYADKRARRRERVSRALAEPPAPPAPDGTWLADGADRIRLTS